MLVNPVFAQVYNYNPINHYDPEINPAILASYKINNQIQLGHQNSFSSKMPFSMNSLRFSKYFPSAFSGLGLSVNNTNMGNNIYYNDIGLGAGYRNVLFNAILLKLGATYKLVNTSAPAGSFDHYSFTPSDTIKKKNTKGNMNLAMCFSLSDDDMFYISLGILNVDVPWNKTNNSIQFPTYNVINIGNFMNLFDRRNSELSYTGFSKLSPTTNILTYSHYISFRFIKPFNRKSTLTYGSRIGFAENKYIHCIPFVGFYTRRLMFTLSYNFNLDKIHFQTNSISTSQIKLIYMLWKQKR